MASRFSIEAVYRAIDFLTKPVRKMTIENKKFVNTIKTDFAKAQRSVQKFGENFKRVLQIGIGVALAAAGIAISKGIELASDLVEVQNVVDTTFEGSANTINQWSKTAIDAYGLSELQAKEFTGTMGSMLKASKISGENLAEMSMNISGLAGDIASFRNLRPEEAFEKLQSIVTGTTKPLRSLGIDMTVANLEAFALSKGITKSFKKMTEAEKVTLRYNFVLEKTRDMQGDFNKTLQTSFANQKRVLQTKFAQKMANAMTKLLPLLIKGGIFLNKMLDNFDEEKVGRFIVKIVTGLVKITSVVIKVLKFLKPFLPFILGIVIAWQAYQKAMLIAAAAQMLFNIIMSANPVGLIIIAIGILIGLIILLVKNWDKVKAAVIKFVKASIEWFKKMVDKAFKLFDKFSALGLIISAPFTILISIIKSIIENWDEITKAFKEGGVKAGILAIGKAILDGILVPIQSFLQLVSKIPGVGDLAAGGAEKIAKIRENLFKESVATTPITPAERSTLIREERTDRGEVVIKDESGRAEMTKKPNGNNFKLQIQSSGGF
jgi:hypothetical protein